MSEFMAYCKTIAQWTSVVGKENVKIRSSMYKDRPVFSDPFIQVLKVNLPPNCVNKIAERVANVEFIDFSNLLSELFNDRLAHIRRLNAVSFEIFNVRPAKLHV